MTRFNGIGASQRRDFLKLAGAAGLASLPGAAVAAEEVATPVTTRMSEAVRTAEPMEVKPEDIRALRPAALAHSERNQQFPGFDIAPAPDAYGSEATRNLPLRPIPPAIRDIPELSREGQLTENGEVVTEMKKGGKYKQTQKPAVSFHAYDALGDASADTNMAVSSSHVVVTTRTDAAYFKRDGTVVKAAFSLSDFFKNIMTSLGVNHIFDSRSIWDPFRKRFWIGTLAFKVDSKGNETSPKTRYVLMAVSKSEDPTDGWWLHYWRSGEKLGDSSDYLVLAVHKDCIVASNNATRASDGTGYHNVCFYLAADMINGHSGSGWRFTGLTNPATGNTPDFVQPVMHHGSSPGLYLSGRDGDDLVVWKVKDPVSSSQSLSAFSPFNLGKLNSPQAAPQKGGSRKLWMQNPGNRIYKAVWRSGMIHVCLEDAVDWYKDGDALTSIRLGRFQLPDHPSPGWPKRHRVFGCNNVFDDPTGSKFYYGFPGLEVGKEGDITLVYVRSGATGYPEVRYSVWMNDEDDIRPSRQLKAGEKAYNWTALKPPQYAILPWADIAGICVDPTDDSSVWFATCFATSAKDNNWGTWVGQVSTR
jgi:hypothetical protein